VARSTKYIIKQRLRRETCGKGKGKGKSKSEVVSVFLTEHHAMKAYWGVEA
jgi:hypothetical protein